MLGRWFPTPVLELKRLLRCIERHLCLVMAVSKLKAAILIVSDTAFKDPSTDKAGGILTQVFASDGRDQWLVNRPEIVPDDVLAIQRIVREVCDTEDYANVLVTTGGTGFAVKDNTPEAVGPFIHRHAPGLV